MSASFSPVLLQSYLKRGEAGRLYSLVHPLCAMHSVMRHWRRKGKKGGERGSATLSAPELRARHGLDRAQLVIRRKKKSLRKERRGERKSAGQWAKAHFNNSLASVAAGRGRGKV